MGKEQGVNRRRIRSWGRIFIVPVTLMVALIAYLYVEGRPRQGRPQYVAMGSSFAAGPAITEYAADSPCFCARSRDNYPHQLARLRGLSLVDVSCGGATTHHILDGGQLLQPAQIEAVTAETELVTVTIGGNDIRYLANLMAMGCNEHTPRYLQWIGGCTVRSIDSIEKRIPGLQAQLVSIVQELRRRAPKARIVLVTYPAVLPDNGTCARLDLSEEEAAQMRGIAAKLAAVTGVAAQATGATLFDTERLSRGHDICAPDPWIVEMHPPGGLLAAPLHPTLAGMTSIAQGLDSLLNE